MSSLGCLRCIRAYRLVVQQTPHNHSTLKQRQTFGYFYCDFLLDGSWDALLTLPHMGLWCSAELLCMLVYAYYICSHATPPVRSNRCTRRGRSERRQRRDRRQRHWAWWAQSALKVTLRTQTHLLHTTPWRQVSPWKSYTSKSLVTFPQIWFVHFDFKSDFVTLAWRTTPCSLSRPTGRSWRSWRGRRSSRNSNSSTRMARQTVRWCAHGSVELSTMFTSFVIV